MYIDDSGNPSIRADRRFFVLSGVLVHESEMTGMKNAVDEFKRNNFQGNYLNAEIHTYDIYKARKSFTGLSASQKTTILDNLYEVIKNLPIKIISVGVDKSKITSQRTDLVEYAWTFLMERCDGFLENDANPNKGMLRIDRSCRIQEGKIIQIVNQLRRNGSPYQRINNIVEEPIFYASHQRKGLQLADAVAYCTQRHLNHLVDFDVYWDIIKEKLWRDGSGNFDGYGLKIFPR